MSNQQLLTMEQVNALSQERFVATLGGLFERSPWIAEQVWGARPFARWTDLYRALYAVMSQASVDQHLALIRAHPDLVGEAARSGTLTQASTQEQAAAGLNRLSSDEIELFSRYNGQYHHTFGFPFVICARENKKEVILAGFATRLTHDRDQEIATALHEISRIARLRLLDTVEHSPEEA